METNFKEKIVHGVRVPKEQILAALLSELVVVVYPLCNASKQHFDEVLCINISVQLVVRERVDDVLFGHKLNEGLKATMEGNRVEHTLVLDPDIWLSNFSKKA